MHQLIHEINSRIFYQLLDILKPRIWERSCNRSRRQIFLQPTWINFKRRQNVIATINSPKKFQLVLPTSCNINTFTPENEAAFIFHRQIFLKPTWINFEKRQNTIASINSRKKFQLVLPTSCNINTLALGAKLPSISAVKYFCNQLELTLKREKIQLHQLIHERNSRIFYQLLDILKPRLWDRSCHRSPSSNISATNLN